MDKDPIVVGVDGSATSVAALRWAGTQADLLDLPVDAVLVTPDRHDTGPDPQVVLATAVEIAVSRMRTRRPPRLSHHVVRGDPVTVLTERSHHATFLVLGRTLGRDPLRTSTMARCLRRAGCPVAVVPSSVPEPGVPGAVAPSSVYELLGDRRVGDVLTSPLLAVQDDAGLDVALQIMVGAQVHHLPVLREGKCVGLLYEVDVVWNMASWPLLDRPPTAGEIARTPVPLLQVNRPVRQAALEIAEGVGDAVVVTDEEHRVLGVLTASDLAALLAADHPAGATSGRPAPSASSRQPQQQGPGHHGR